MLVILLAVFFMAAKDVTNTLMIISESRGKALQSGLIGSLGDLTSLGTYTVGVGTVIKDGFSPHTILVILSIMVTSFTVTTITTHYGSKHIKAAQSLKDAIQ